MRRAVFLDRDGVINRVTLHGGKPYPPKGLAQLRLLPGVREACRSLREMGFLLILVTNQPDIARRTTDEADVAAIHAKLTRFLQLDEVKLCPHDDSDGCECRKPRPGMMIEAARRWGIDLASSYLVGDRWRDVEAGQRAGCQPIFIDYGYRERQPEGVFVKVRSLREAAAWIGRSLRREQAQQRTLRPVA